jgi:putative acetyltransferase
VAVRDAWQGRGVGTALMRVALDLADDWLGLTRVDLIVYAGNAPGAAPYEEFGFEVEGTHRRYAFRDRAYVDAYTMARLR